MKKLTYSTLRTPKRLKANICEHCKQITMFGDCLVFVEVYGKYVCWDCLKRLYEECEGCQRYYEKGDSRLHELHEGGKVCQDCVDDGSYVFCRECMGLFDVEEVKVVSDFYSDPYVCGECASRLYEECSFCRELYRGHDLGHDAEDSTCCDRCSEEIGCCEECGVFYPFEDLSYVESRDGYYCEGCCDHLFSFCDFCGEMEHRDSIFHFEGRYYCEHCGHEEGLPLVGGSGRLIQGHSFKPKPHFYRLEGEKNDCYTTGVELEVENVDEKISNSEMVRKLVEKFGGFLYYKEDSSIRHGFEIVSHPFTWGWYKKNRERLSEGLRLLRENGFKSYELGTCGIHIHLSKNAFVHNLHMYKFLKIFYENFAFIKKISQRDAKSTRSGCQWGRCPEDGHSEQPIMIKKAKDKYYPGKYTAVNLQNPHTVEIRIFRGTLKDESFFKNFEFLKSVFEFANVTGVKDITVKKLVEYVSENRKSYNNLFNFMEKRGMV